MGSFDLPYFDEILKGLESHPDSSLAAAFRRHVHWGYFVSPDTADDSLQAYVTAAEELTARICNAGQVKSGLRILDVGCGFGGTLDYLNQRLSNCELIGLNIDERQLARARELVRPTSSGNTIAFVEGDACALPFEPGRFDVILAVECIFHFASRKQFFREVRRVLQPGGTFALSDFVVREGALGELADWMTSNAVPSSSFYGRSAGLAPTSSGYARLGKVNAFEVLSDENVTTYTLPTYAAMRRLYRDAGLHEGELATNYLEATARKNLLEYHLLAFRSK